MIMTDQSSHPEGIGPLIRIFKCIINITNSNNKNNVHSFITF
jgi:hypothetical protein